MCCVFLFSAAISETMRYLQILNIKRARTYDFLFRKVNLYLSIFFQLHIYQKVIIETMGLSISMKMVSIIFSFLLISSIKAHLVDQVNNLQINSLVKQRKTTGKLPECSPCNSGRECQSGLCPGYPGKCVKKYAYSSMVKCGFKMECETCFGAHECATSDCWGPGGVRARCTYKSDKSMKKCFPEPKMINCVSCSKNSDCESGVCYGFPRKCVKSTDYSDLIVCGFKAECEQCSRSDECSTKNCSSRRKGYKPICTYKYRYWSKRCSKKRELEKKSYGTPKKS